MKPYVIGICGGSGSGKSTLAFGLADSYPDEVTIIHLDDYFRPEADVPLLHGMRNWDDPRALYSDKMVHDLDLLKQGQPVVINTKSPRLNPDFLKTGKRVPAEFQPKPLIVVEGFLTLYFKELRQLLDMTIYLDAPFELHTGRRIHGKLHNFPADYNQLVLRPMHQQFVAPYRALSDLKIDVSALSAEAVLQTVKNKLSAFV